MSRSHIHAPHSVSERIADWITARIGSMTFIVLQSALYLTWLTYNGIVAVHFLRSGAFDPYPFILLNLLLSTQAFYAAPFILMSQNRQAAKDKSRDDHEAEEVSLLHDMNLEQLEILRLLHTQHTDS